MIYNEDIYFDDSSGISIEEQKEILSKINGIAEKNKQQFTETAVHITDSAKKKSLFFPVIVNAAAILILCAGAFILISLNNRKDSSIREGTAVFDLTERALIEEIRKETARQILEKEMEINTILTRLEDVDTQLSLLYSSNLELSAEQLATEQLLLASQSEFRSNLSSLQEERSQILEASRAREARLRAQMEERTREIAADRQRVESELDSAMAELERLSSEQERIASIDSQLAGGIAAVATLIENNQFVQAEQSIENLINFNNNNNVAGARAFQTRREFYNQTLNSLAISIEVLKNNTDASAGTDEIREQRDLQARNTELENTVAQMQRTLDAFSEGSSGLSLRINELEETSVALRATNTQLETAAAEKDRTINALETRVAERERTIQTLETERANLNQSVANLNQSVADLRTVTNEQDAEIQNLRSQLQIIRQALQE